MQITDLDGLVALPSLMSEQHFMMAHAVATQAGLLPRRGVVVRTLDVGGAGPVAALLAAQRMILHEGRKAVAVVAGDTVASVPTSEFLARADATCAAPGRPLPPSPVIPHLYDRVAQMQMRRHGVTREQLAMVASLMTLQASRHPDALHRRSRPLPEVLAARAVAPATTALECAKLADGGAALVVVAGDAAGGWDRALARGVDVLGGGEASGPLPPPEGADCGEADGALSAASEAAGVAYGAAGCRPEHIDYFSIYDCFPVCFIRGVEAVGLAAPGQGGRFVEAAYRQYFEPPGIPPEPLLQQLKQQGSHSPSTGQGSGGAGSRGADSEAVPGHAAQGVGSGGARGVWPVNTHGGLLGFGAPWEVPALYGIIEAVQQLRGCAVGRQVAGARRALVYGNGGVFSAAAVAVLGARALRDDAGTSRL